MSVAKISVVIALLFLPILSMLKKIAGSIVRVSKLCGSSNYLFADPDLLFAITLKVFKNSILFSLLFI